MMAGKPVSFVTGIPTAPTIERLRKRFGVPAPGTLLSYTDIAEVAETEVHSHRFNSVVTAYRKKLYRESNIVLRAVANEGYEVLDSHGRVHEFTRGFKSGIIKTRRAADMAVATDETGLSEEEKRTRLFVFNTAGTLQLAVATAAKQLKLPAPK